MVKSGGKKFLIPLPLTMLKFFSFYSEERFTMREKIKTVRQKNVAVCGKSKNPIGFPVPLSGQPSINSLI